MFSNKTQKLLSLQNDYIERINKNAVKLDKQLNFLMDVQKHITKQMGGAFERNLEEFPTLGQTTKDAANARQDQIDNQQASNKEIAQAKSKKWL